MISAIFVLHEIFGSSNGPSILIENINDWSHIMYSSQFE